MIEFWTSIKHELKIMKLPEQIDITVVKSLAASGQKMKT